MIGKGFFLDFFGKIMWGLKDWYVSSLSNKGLRKGLMAVYNGLLHRARWILSVNLKKQSKLCKGKIDKDAISMYMVLMCV